MLFNSLGYIVFFTLIFISYWFLLNKNLNFQNRLLLIASYAFYSWWSWKFLGLLIISTILDFIYGIYVASPNRKKAKLFVSLSIINNLGILAIFKYYNFFIEQFQMAFKPFGLNIHPSFLLIALPVGISFYTFHGMSYVFDIYRGKILPEKNLAVYAVFVSFFPLLVAGPIERANHLLPQIKKNRVFSYGQAIEGCKLLIWGMFKKVVIADSLSPIADTIFENYQTNNASTLILGIIVFSFQIYGDFSGYSDIAIGSAKLLGFELLTNFKFPYFSRDIAEFWRRWHISLSSWFKDYLYIPIGGSKDGKLKAIRNTFIIFLVSGFWHGASWNFIVWGTIHACGFLPLLVLNRNRLYSSTVVAQNRSLPNLKELLQMISTFSYVAFAWIFFRISGISNALGFINKLIADAISNPSQFLHPPVGKSAFIYIIPFLMGDWICRRNERNLISFNNTILNFMLFFVLLALIQLKFGEKSAFIYFQF
jgi:alginate O-acetyltransferase complex protein AlgI